ncbi:MAG TPA: hypothetical protein VIJ68_01625 [Candidatus Saccharimonadales bacterium]
MPDHLKHMFEPPDWFNVEEAEEDLSFFSELTPLNLYRVAGSLGAIERLGKLPNDITSMFEFGSGYGEGLVALDMLARARGDAKVQGSESGEHPHYIASQISRMLLERVTDVSWDGFQSMHEGPESFDVILAHMFGPSYTSEEVPARFIPAAPGALKAEGVIIISSDEDTMGNVQTWAERNLPAGQAETIDDESLPSGFMTQPHLVITS